MIPSNILKRVRALEIKTRRAISSSLAGSYHSIFKGQGINFSEVRTYYYGDDVRRIDWNVTAKTQSPHIKEFEEERELTVILMIDLSGSGSFGSGSQSKMEVAAEIAAALGFSALSNNDRVGLLLFSDQVELYIPPKKGKKHMFRCLRDIFYHQEKSKKTSIHNALSKLLSLLKKRAIVFLISDFADHHYEDNLRLASQKHELIPIVVEDPNETILPKAGLITIEDPETGEIITINSNSTDIQNRFNNIQLARTMERQRIFRSSQLDPITITLGAPVLDPIIHYFNKRRR